LGRPVLNTLVIGEDILAKYLFYLFACCSAMVPFTPNVYVHGMIMSDGRKISKYGNFPEVSDVVAFLQKWSWDHLRLLCLSCTFGNNIDFEKRIFEVEKLLIKRRHVLKFLHSVKQETNLKYTEMTETERHIVEYCMQLKADIKALNLGAFFQEYRLLWYDYLSRRYISSLRDGDGSRDGLARIIQLCTSIP